MFEILCFVGLGFLLFLSISCIAGAISGVWKSYKAHKDFRGQYHQPKPPKRSKITKSLQCKLHCRDFLVSVSWL